MGLFSGTDERKASVWAAQQATNNAYAAANWQLYGQNNAIGALDAAQPQSLAALGQGFDQARDQYGQASAMYQPYADTGLKAFNQYADATGVNGQGGYDASVNNFRAGPGYQYRVDQALDQVQRRAGSTGTLSSGNTLASMSDRAGHMADQEYDQYLGRLSGLGQVGYNATGAQAGLQRGIGDLYAQQGQGEANIYQQGGRDRANVYTGVGNNMTNVLTHTGDQILKAGQQGMMAGDDIAKNQWSLGLGLANTAASLAGLKMPGGGTVGGSLFSKLF